MVQQLLDPYHLLGMTLEQVVLGLPGLVLPEVQVALRLLLLLAEPHLGLDLADLVLE